MPVLHAPTYEWTVEEYEKLGEVGIFTANDRVELLNGQIVVMPRVSYRHTVTTVLLNKFFILRSLDRYEVTPGNPFILDERSEPQPDLCLVDPAVDTQGHHPGPEQVFLAIEVSDSTLRYDREDKRPAYARGGVREYWIVNLADNVFEVYRDPVGETYRDAQTLDAEATIAPLAFPDVELRVGDFLP